MKKIITILTVLMCVNGMLAQNVTYDLRWNASNSEYEFYVSRDITAVVPFTVGGTSTVTIVFPTDVSGTRTVAHTSESVSNYNPAGVIRSPGASPSNDYYVFNTVGGSSYIGVLNADTEVLWMTFSASDGNSKARLFVNDSDPNSGAAGMMGINARQEFFVLTPAGANNEYAGNILLSTPENELVDHFLIYPNPASDVVNIETNAQLTKVTLFDVLGKEVLSTKGTTQLKVDQFKAGVYFLKMHKANNTLTRRIIIE